MKRYYSYDTIFSNVDLYKIDLSEEEEKREEEELDNKIFLVELISHKQLLCNN